MEDIMIKILEGIVIFNIAFLAWLLGGKENE